MAITEFECVGNKHLGYRGIKSVKMTPLHKLQMILGTNGSGKSTIMGELSPLAAKPENYERGGYKKTVHSHRGHTYECLSDFTGPKNHYAITKDDVVLFSGHSSEAYASHVLQEFGMNRDLHDIRTGRKRLTSMDIDTRRKLFTKMSPEDYTYAIGYYKRLADSTRDISGTIKRLNTKLMQEKSKLINEEDEAKMRLEIKELAEQKNQMMRHWRPTEDSVASILDKVDTIDRTLDDMVSGFMSSLKSFCNAKGYADQAGIWADISQAQGRLSYLESKTAEIFETIDANRALVDQAREAMGQDIGELNQQLGKVSREISLTTLGIFTADDWKDIGNEALLAYDAVFNSLMAVIDELVPDTELIYTPDKHRERAEKISQLTAHISALQAQARDFSEQISIADHRKEDSHTACPKCEHVWFRGFDQAHYDHIKDSRAKIDAQLEKLTATYDSLVETQETSAYQLNLYQQVTMIARSTPILEPIWTGLSKCSFMRLLPAKAGEYVRVVRREIELNQRLTELKVQKAELTAAIKSATEMSGVNQRELIAKNDALESQLVIYQAETSQLGKLVTGLQRAQKAMEYQEKYIPLTEDLLMKRQDLLSKAEIANHHAAINAVVMQLDASISQKERLISQIDSQHQLIRALEDEVNSCTSKEVYLKQSLKALSPVNGLIAKGLTGFINHFIAQMNTIIQEVWLYPLAIKPIKMSEDDAVNLDYKFSYTVEGKDAGKDVSQGSGAQQEIFDLAFMVVALIHHGMEDSEVFLDEFSIKMDYAHRKAAMRMVTKMLSESNFSQIFMISHYESSYASLTNADITVLCDENILLPSELKYNINAEIIS